MFDVLNFVYDNYDAGDPGLAPLQLGRKLIGIGFEADAVQAAMDWLHGMDCAAHPQPLQPWLVQPGQASVRVYPPHEQLVLGIKAIGFISFLEAAGALPAHMRELVIDRALAAQSTPVSLDDLKTIILLVYWRFGYEPDTLLLDELLSDPGPRVLH